MNIGDYMCGSFLMMILLSESELCCFKSKRH